MHLFTATTHQADLIDCDEGDLEWVDKDKVKDLPHLDRGQDLPGPAGPGGPLFSLKLAYEGDTLVQAVLNGNPISTEP